MTRLSTIAMILVLSGCVVGPNYQAPATTVPEHWSGDPGEPDSAEALNLFGRVSRPCSSRLIQQAIDSNYDLKIAGERIRAAHDAVRVAAADDLPQIGIGAAAESRRETQTIDWPPASPKYGEYPYYALGFNASWELDLFGETRRKKESARAAADAAVQHAVRLDQPNGGRGEQLLSIRATLLRLQIAREILTSPGERKSLPIVPSSLASVHTWT